MLIVHSAEGLKKNQIRVPKDKGIVGNVLITKEKLKIDDAYQDVRFNKVDKKTGFKTKNILCYSLIDSDNHCFGAIQEINKKKYFNNFYYYNDDEMKVFNVINNNINNIINENNDIINNNINNI